MNLEVAEREFEAAILGVIVVANGESDVERISRQEIGSLKAFGHVPAEGVKSNPAAPVLSPRLAVLSKRRSILGRGAYFGSGN